MSPLIGVGGVGKRGKAGAGCYPVLSAFGIDFGVSPAALVEIRRQVADSDSVRSGRGALSRRGLDLGHQQTLRIVSHASQRAVQQRADMIGEALETEPTRGMLSEINGRAYTSVTELDVIGSAK